MQIIADRRALHRIPERAMCLPKTAAYLRQALEGLSCQVFSPIEHAVCAWFDFGAERTIAFRADMDALPITERTGLPFASEHPGFMHACGHDGHMAIGLELARRLDRQEAFPNNVLLVFQPGEETPGGARPLCETGFLEQYGVEAIFALHLWPGQEAGTLASREGPMLSRVSELTVEIFGKPAHIAKSWESIDALAAGYRFYSRIRALEASLDPAVHRLLNFGKMESGTVRNIISGYTRLEGSLRAFEDPVFDHLHSGIQSIARDVEAETGCQVKLHFSDGYPAVTNDPTLYQKAHSLVDFADLEAPSMISEDFAFFQKRVPGIFFFLGLGNTPALHNDNFDFDEEILLKGADFFETLAKQYR